MGDVAVYGWQFFVSNFVDKLLPEPVSQIMSWRMSYSHSVAVRALSM